MENRITILNELTEISSVVAAVGHQNPYTVPVGYFEGLAEQLLNRVKDMEAPLSETLQKAITNPYTVPDEYFVILPEQLLQWAKAQSQDPELSDMLQKATANPYTVPQGYFDTLPEQLLQSARAQSQDAALPNLLQDATANPYTVPQGYFDTLPEQLLQSAKANLVQANKNPYEAPQGYFESLPATILNRIKADSAADADEELETLSPLLKQIGKKNPFSTPAGYFADLTENTMAGARAINFVNNELDNSSLLQGLQHKQVYEVPPAYFEQLPDQLLQKVQPKGKVVSMRRRFMQYAAAAVVAGLLFTAGWMYLGNNGNKATNGEIPQVVADKLDKVSDEVLESYIQNEALIPVEATVTASNDIDMKAMLADVPDEDLQMYLEKYNTSKDIITN